jgi:hypothetical protein
MGCPVNRGRYSSEIFMFKVVNDIEFHKALNFMSISVVCLKLSCGIKK